MASDVSALEAAKFFEVRARRANIEAALRVMNRVGGEPPRSGDELPQGYKPGGDKVAN